MRYAKPWKGNAHGVSSTYTQAPHVSLLVVIDRPDTADHGRRIYINLDASEARAIAEALERHADKIEQVIKASA